MRPIFPCFVFKIEWNNVNCSLHVFSGVQEGQSS